MTSRHTPCTRWRTPPPLFARMPIEPDELSDDKNVAGKGNKHQYDRRGFAGQSHLADDRHQHESAAANCADDEGQAEEAGIPAGMFGLNPIPKVDDPCLHHPQYETYPSCCAETD